jgi:hypothetical protein
LHAEEANRPSLTSGWSAGIRRKPIVRRIFDYSMAFEIKARLASFHIFPLKKENENE